MKLMIGIFALGMALSGGGLAEVRFPQTAKALKAPAGAETVKAEYKFTNAGSEAVKINKIKVSCSCMNAEQDKETYAPGAGGVITLNFQLGLMTGSMEKNATVYFTDGTKKVLHAKVQVPEVFTMSPPTLKWKVGEKRRPKPIDIRVGGKDPIDVTDVTPTGSGFEAKLKTIKPGRHYQVIVTPKSTGAPVMEMLRVETNSKIKRFRVNNVFAVVAPAPRDPSRRR